MHFQDLVTLDPLDAELEDAADWVACQDPAPGFAALVEEEGAMFETRSAEIADLAAATAAGA